MTGADCFETNRKRIRGTQGYLHNWNSSSSSILYIPVIYIYSLLVLRYLLQPITIGFTALSCFFRSAKKTCKQTSLISLSRVLFALYPGPKRFRAISSRRLGKSEGRSKTDACFARYPPPSQFALSFHSVIWYPNRSTTRWQKGEKKRKNSSKLNVRQHKGRRKKDKKICTPWDSLLPPCFFKLVRSPNYAVFLPRRNWLFQIIWGEDIPLYSITWLIQKPKAQRHVC